ncbi:PPIase cyclophilin-type domain-containing protein [Aphelenchoides fujianensis]|nr:PPIase cyclophilin-type domain-containing protein [Aphelenchoides fujianensis]
MSSQYITEPATYGKVCLETTLGDIDIELWSKECPLACRNFVQLCMEGYYNKCTFHTVIKDAIVQTGDPTNTGQGGKSVFDEDFKIEPHQRLRFNRRGLVAMAANPQKLNGSQFFLTLGPTSELQGKHTLFGKITGNTIFNLMTINEVEVDAENRPTKAEKITGARILNNPFKDIVPRKLAEEKPKKKSKKDREAKEQRPANKNTGLLSFGDEMDEEEEIINAVSKKLKGKSAHDVLDDEKLSKQLAVQPEELGNYDGKEDEEEAEGSSALSKVQERLKGRHRKGKRKHSDDEEDVDLAERSRGAEAERRDGLKSEESSFRFTHLFSSFRERLAAEVKALQKAYMKDVRGPKAKPNADDESALTDGMKSYKSMRLKFKTKTEGIVSQIDPQRESQTMHILQKFQTTLKRATGGVEDILRNKKLIKEGAVPKKRKLPADMLPDYGEDEEEYEEEEEEEQEEKMDVQQPPPDDANKLRFDEEAVDETSGTWMAAPLVAPEDTSGVTKAKDANLKDEIDDWYDITGEYPRNKMNVRRREGGAI